MIFVNVLVLDFMWDEFNELFIIVLGLDLFNISVCFLYFLN